MKNLNSAADCTFFRPGIEVTTLELPCQLRLRSNGESSTRNSKYLIFTFCCRSTSLETTENRRAGVRLLEQAGRAGVPLRARKRRETLQGSVVQRQRRILPFRSEIGSTTIQLPGRRRNQSRRKYFRYVLFPAQPLPGPVSGLVFPCRGYSSNWIPNNK